MKRKVLLGLFLVTIISAAALADGVEITPAIGYRFGGGFYDYSSRQDIDLEDAESGSITLGFEVNEDYTIEAHWSVQETRFEVRNVLPPMLDDDGIEVEYWHVGVMVRPGKEDSVEPFIVASAGFTRFDPEASGTGSDTRFSISFGGGVRTMFGEHVGIRLQGRLYLSFVHGSTAAICGGGGCSFGFHGDGLWQGDVSAGLIFAF
jgi:opacity protein-like surface antigen